MGVGEAHLDGPASVLDGRHWRRAGAAVVAGDLYHIGRGLGDAAGDGADAGLGHQLDRHLQRVHALLP